MTINGTPVDYERAKTDFVYWATHCAIDARTGEKVQWTKAQLKVLEKLSKLDSQHIIYLRHRGREFTFYHQIWQQYQATKNAQFAAI